MNKSKIEWTESTWNPVTGCLHDCPYCYAKKIAERFKPKQADFDPVFTGSEETQPNTHCKGYELIPQLRDSKGRALAYPFGFTPTFHRYRLDEYKNKSARTIFVCSMADLFGEWVPDRWIEDVFAACKQAPQHRYLFLTKNPKRYINLAERGKLPYDNNMWYGTTATKMNDTFFYGDNYNTFLSVEPIQDRIPCFGFMPPPNWVIVGAETGNRKGKIIPKRKWIENIAYSCKHENIPLFMKDSLIPIVGEENMIRQFPWTHKT